MLMRWCSVFNFPFSLFLLLKRFCHEIISTKQKGKDGSQSEATTNKVQQHVRNNSSPKIHPLPASLAS